ncbi:MAG: hypothetical protein GVY24_02735 [Planctomycetes bacterium]|nr:hypothetical protein [Planctomycetota bacterium]
MPDFLPRREADLLVWSANFRAQINATPEAFGLTAADAADFDVAQHAFSEAYRAAIHPSTRTVPRVAAKNEARDAMMRLARELAGVVRARRATTAAQMQMLGLRPRAAARRVVPRPSSSPVVRVMTGMGRQLTVQVMERETGRSRKPADVTLVELWYATGDRPPGSASAGWRRLCVTGQLRLMVQAPTEAQPGDRLWVSGCWLNDRGDAGPWSTPTWGYVNYGGGPTRTAMRVAA